MLWVPVLPKMLILSSEVHNTAVASALSADLAVGDDGIGAPSLTAVNTDGSSSGFRQGICSQNADLIFTNVFAHSALDTEFFLSLNAGIVQINGDTYTQR